MALSKWGSFEQEIEAICFGAATLPSSTYTSGFGCVLGLVGDGSYGPVTAVTAASNCCLH